jgi:hypothetical protein
MVTGVSDLGDGRLLVFLRMTDPTANLSPEAHGAPDLAGVFDTEIQMIDAQTGGMLARRRIPEFPAGPVSGAQFHINRQDRDQFWIEILEVLQERLGRPVERPPGRTPSDWR